MAFSARRGSPSFAFTPENGVYAEQIAKYPAGRQASAVIPLLWRAQEQDGGWLPRKAIEAVAARLGMPKIRVMEVATFYTMFNLDPVGKYFIQFCGTTPCVLRGAGEIRGVLERRIGEQQPRHAGRATSPGSRSSALARAAMRRWCRSITITTKTCTIENFENLLDDLAAGRPVKAGPQIGGVLVGAAWRREDADRSVALRRLDDRRLAQALRGGGFEGGRDRRGRCCRLPARLAIAKAGKTAMRVAPSRPRRRIRRPSA